MECISRLGDRALHGFTELFRFSDSLHGHRLWKSKRSELGAH
jgi:hypothetical protein